MNSYIGLGISILIGFIVFVPILRYRAKKILDIQMTFSQAFKISYKSVIIFIAFFNMMQAIGQYIGGLGSIGMILVGMIGGIIIMQHHLKGELIKESLDELNAKKLAGSAVSYYFWISILLSFILVIGISLLLASQFKSGESYVKELEKMAAEERIENYNATESSSKVGTGDLFDKKSKCYQLQKELTLKLQEGQEIAEVFYSKKNDSCVVYYKSKYGYQLIDGLTGEYLAGVDITKDDTTLLQSLHTFQAIGKELKSE